MLLLNLVPWYVRLGAMVALVVASFCLGAVKGMEYQEGVQARAEVKHEQHAGVVRKQHAVEKTKIEKVYIERKEHRDADKERINAETVEHAKLPDPPGCALAPERVRGINDAWGVGAAADSGAGPAGVRDTAAAEERKPSGSGAMGEGARVRVPGVQGSSSGAGREGAAPSTAGGKR